MPLEWDKNSAGNVWLTPLIRFQTADLHGLGVGLRLELATDPAAQSSYLPGESQTLGMVAQVAMSVDQTLELIAVLQLRVDAIRLARPQGPVH